jgi:hypothetical protein
VWDFGGIILTWKTGVLGKKSVSGSANPCFALPYFTSSARKRDKNNNRVLLSLSRCGKTIYLLYAAATTSDAVTVKRELTFF